MRIVSWLSAICLMFVTAQAAATDTLYRGDWREPATVFADGFRGPGTNRNVLAHISGESCYYGEGATRSAYVAASTVESEARRYGQSVHEPRSYVYQIMPDADAPNEMAFFAARVGLHNLAGRPELGLDFRVQTTIWRLAGHPMTTNAYFSERIPPEWIRSVDIYERHPVTGEMGFVRNELNPRFVRPLRIGGRGAFTQAMITALAPVESIVVGGPGNSVGAACMGGCSAASARSVPPLVAPRTLEQCSLEEVFIPGNPFQQLMDIILDDGA